ncbi:hypothetical protein KVR01_001723 [Diaporthe batatas]|uniref:uncharacterized protein n=1 Tax=Diaporthe batatas TaxID=748121 RepID=UPI001D042067|nr:uncharacterized protein KVR01_001723 [Diaporthe batatas]KAG8168974.1 hypothetical protein KVR01_001723 [Diaporthe batatas]
MQRAKLKGSRPQTRPQADGLQETRYRGLSSQSTSSNSLGTGDQFNAPQGNMSVTQGPGNQFPGANFQGTVNFHTTGKAHSASPLQECLQSLAFPEMDRRSNDIDIAAQGTCEWLFQHEKFTRWERSDRALLWIKGKPGSGKSTLLRHVLKQLEVKKGGEDLIFLSFFFHGRGSELQKTPSGLFRALLYQLITSNLDQTPDAAITGFVNDFERQCKTRGKLGEGWQWDPQALRRSLNSLLQSVLTTRPVWLFIDALDECGRKDAVRLVEEFKSLLKSSQYNSSKQFHICFTCRHYPNLDMNTDDLFEIHVEDENRTDISTFVGEKLSSFQGRTKSSIPDLIIQRANGVFLWAELVVKNVLDLDRDGETVCKIEAEISSVPQELDDLFRELIREMDSASLKLIQWICFAMRPLTVDELRWAMFIDVDCRHRSLQACHNSKHYEPDSKRFKRRVQTLSRGLAEVTSDEQTVQFIHQSVKDFFIQKGLSALDTSPTIRFFTALEVIHQSIKDFSIKKGPSVLDEGPGLYMSTTLIVLATVFFYLHYFTRGPQSLSPGHSSPPPIIRAMVSAFLVRGVSVRDAKADFIARIAHYRLSRICIRYLAMEEVGRSTEHEDDDFPFLRYALTSWVPHTKASDARSVPQEDLLECFEWSSHSVVERWVRVYREIHALKYSNYHPPDGTSLVHVLSRYGLLGPLRVIMQRADHTDVDIKDGVGRTPLSYAAEFGHEAVIRLLLDNGAYIETADKNGRTPLSRATTQGHGAVIQLLLDNGAYIEAADNDGWTPLMYAVTPWLKPVVRQLYHSGPSGPNSEFRDYQLQLRLIEDLNRKRLMKAGQRQALATTNNREAFVRLLLDKGANIQVKDKDGLTLLWCATILGEEAVIRLLLDKGANTEGTDKVGNTLVSYAIKDNNKPVVRLLQLHTTVGLEESPHPRPKHNYNLRPRHT